MTVNKSSITGPFDTTVITIIIVMVVVTTTVGYSATLNPKSSSTGPLASTSTSGVETSTAPAVLAWNPSVSYPVTALTQSCVESGGYIYCVGGETESGSVVNNVWYSS